MRKPDRHSEVERRIRPYLVATRVDEIEKKLIEAGAAAAGQKAISHFIRSAVLDAARKVLAAQT